eukprot:gnl/MRDRNA2_/MRDRNA2_48645_c0_seq1.p1 gnl/MRDRNA2_/MRDRNA2_48645_c0~~gnl/MRDRNA2_/MRDRNA2_48645_c0_seq1.p1  ORF type:complete len:209 (-),score=30.80 gnl/MRDRNA2_/MRDRNA2_48645_c0_seq1:298-858(-)
MAPVATKALPPATPEQLELWKSTASWNREASWSSDSSGETYVRASRVPTLRLEMEKWNFGKAMAIEKVSQLELDSMDAYIAGNHEAYERLWDEYHEMHDSKALGEDNRRRDGVTLSCATLLYREVQTSLKAGEHEYNLQYPRTVLNRLDSDRRALRFILVKRWRVLLRHVRSLLPGSYDPDKVEIQ